MLNIQIDYLIEKLQSKNEEFTDPQITGLLKQIIQSGSSINCLKDRILNNNFYIDSDNIKEDLIKFRIDNLNWNVEYYENLFNQFGLDFSSEDNSIVVEFNDKNLIKSMNDKNILKLNPHIFNDEEQDGRYFLKLDFNKDVNSPNSSEIVISNFSNKIIKSVNNIGENIYPSFEIPNCSKDDFLDFYNKLSNEEKLIYCCKNNLVSEFNSLIKNEDIYISSQNNKALLTAIDYSSYDIIDRIIEFKNDFIPSPDEDIYGLIKNKEDSMNIDLNGFNNSTIKKIIEKNDLKIIQNFLEQDSVVLKISDKWASENLSDPLYDIYKRTTRKNNFSRAKIDI